MKPDDDGGLLRIGPQLVLIRHGQTDSNVR